MTDKRTITKDKQTQEAFGAIGDIVCDISSRLGVVPVHIAALLSAGDIRAAKDEAEKYAKIPDKAFYSRDPNDVARELVGSLIIRYTLAGPIVGQIEGTRAFHAPAREDQVEAYSRSPGSIYYFNSRRGPIFAMSAHAENELGVISITQVVMGTTIFSATRLFDAFDIPVSWDKLHINSEQLEIKRSPYDAALVGRKIKIIPGKPDDSWSAEYLRQR